MRKIVFLSSLVFMTLVFTSCEKDYNNNGPNYNNSADNDNENHNKPINTVNVDFPDDTTGHVTYEFPKNVWVPIMNAYTPGSFALKSLKNNQGDFKFDESTITRSYRFTSQRLTYKTLGTVDGRNKSMIKSSVDFENDPSESVVPSQEYYSGAFLMEMKWDGQNQAEIRYTCLDLSMVDHNGNLYWPSPHSVIFSFTFIDRTPDGMPRYKLAFPASSRILFTYDSFGPVRWLDLTQMNRNYTLFRDMYTNRFDLATVSDDSAFFFDN